MSGPIDQMRLTGRGRDIVAALRAAGYDVQEPERETNYLHRTVFRKGWMFVGTVTPLGDFDTAELVLHGHNNAPDMMAAVVLALTQL